jgi:hypothetical protein
MTVTKEGLGADGDDCVAEEVGLEHHCEDHLDQIVVLVVVSVFVAYVVYALLDLEAVVDQHEDLAEGKSSYRGLTLGFLDVVVFGLETHVDLSLLLDVKEVSGHQLTQRVDLVNAIIHSMFEPSLKTKN